MYKKLVLCASHAAIFPQKTKNFSNKSPFPPVFAKFAYLAITLPANFRKREVSGPANAFQWIRGHKKESMAATTQEREDMCRNAPAPDYDILMFHLRWKVQSLSVHVGGVERLCDGLKDEGHQ